MSDDDSTISQFDLFFSYSTKDQKVAFELVEELEKRGLKCWIAPRNIPTAKSWAGAIVEGLGQSRAFLLLLTESSNQSNQVLREVERAISNEISVIPVRLSDVAMSADMQYYLSTIQWLDASEISLDQCALRIVDIVNESTDMGAMPLRPDAASGDSSEASFKSDDLESRPASWITYSTAGFLFLLWIGTVLFLPFKIFQDGGGGRDGWEFVVFCAKNFPHVILYPILFSFSFPCLGIAAYRASPYLWTRKTLIGIIICAGFGVLFAFDETKASSGSMMVFNIDESFLRDAEQRANFLGDPDPIDDSQWESGWHARERAFGKMKELDLETRHQNAEESANCCLLYTSPSPRDRG